MKARRKRGLRLDDLDVVAVVEKAYERLAEAPEDVWLRELALAVAPAIEDNQGHAAWLYRIERMSNAAATPLIDVWGFVGNAPAGWIDAAKTAAASGESRVVSMYAKPVSGFAVVGDDPAFARGRLYRDVLRPTGLVDQIALMGADVDGYGIALVAAHGARLDISTRDRLALTRLTSHMIAGLRLRRRLAAGEGHAEAVFELSGTLVHAEGPARTTEARAALRAAVTTIDAARRQRRRLGKLETLARWKALVAGRWSLVDQFERDGRHYLVAKPNLPRGRVPSHAAASRLAPREAQVVAHAVLGHSNKLIAYELGLTESAVAAYITRAKAKLGVRTRMDLFAKSTAEEEMMTTATTIDCVEVGLDGDRFTILTRDPPKMFARLTNAERDVVWAILAGKSNADVAYERSSSVRTVDNQIASAYRKLDVSSRSELAARLRR